MKKDNKFAGKVAWITGASSGIGESLVYKFVESGATVVASSNDGPGLERVKEHVMSDHQWFIVCRLIFQTLQKLTR
jgi:NAD(P)-dependent dehydrogenase (short-subunit alcohol dehydrogenase family)